MSLSKNTKNFSCLQIVPTLGVGGIESGVRDLAKYMNKNHIKNFILCEKNKNNILDESLNIIEFEFSFKNIFDQRLIKKFLEELIKREKINVVHISSRAPAFFLINFLKSKNIKIVSSIHSIFKKGLILKNLYNQSLLNGDFIIFNSNFIQNYHFKNKLKNKFVTIHRGIDIDYFKPISTKSNNIKYIFLPSRVSKIKGHLKLIQYFSNLNPKVRESFNLLIISSNKSNLEKRINKLIIKKNLSHLVKLVKPTLDIRKLYDLSYLTVSFTSIPEGFGRTISESLAMKKPVLAPNIGGAKEQLDKFDKNLLFEIDSFNSFNNALNYVIQNYQNIARHSREYIIKNFSSEIMCSKTIQVYKKLI